ncbi:MAG: D-glycero-beta-D-manno-heptose 1-phosphate adenylyltransferase [candidate division Zixibacteria bacterium]|nr:D-glycero-beta-D-manno-heptose 1-phosphate adenylyltransferase [candidate division Zixibacteria bacterium]
MKKVNNILWKISPKKIETLVANLRKRNKKIVFTNGVFDILHYGHIDYLTKARKLGDFMVVGLNTDSSVRKFKAKGRPIQNEKDRARILAALKPVDYVILFGETTPERLINLVKPDVLVKGADYRIAEIVGAAFVKSYGGVVKRIRVIPGRSTSRIVKKLGL